MNGTERRITRLERTVGAEALDEYRRTVRCLLEIGAIDPPEDGDVEGLIREYADKGQTLKVVLDEISGTSRGLPELEKEKPALGR